MDGLSTENMILHGLSFFGIFLACTFMIGLCIQIQKRYNTFSIIERLWNVSHGAVKFLIIGIILSMALIVLIHSGKWPAASVWSFPGQENNDFERLYLPNLEISTTCAKEEKELARVIFHYKTGFSSTEDVRAAAGRLHQALKSQGYHEYYLNQIVELKKSAFYDKINP